MYELKLNGIDLIYTGRSASIAFFYCSLWLHLLFKLNFNVNLLPDYSKLTPFLKQYIETMGWDDLNWLEDVHMGYEEGRPAIFDRTVNGWVTIPEGTKLPDNQQDRDMIARELLIKFQMSKRHPMVDLNKAYRKFW